MKRIQDYLKYMQTGVNRDRDTEKPYKPFEGYKPQKHRGGITYTAPKLYTHAQILAILGPRHKAKNEAGGVIAFAKNNLLDDQMKRLKKEVI